MKAGHDIACTVASPERRHELGADLASRAGDKDIDRSALHFSPPLSHLDISNEAAPVRDPFPRLVLGLYNDAVKTLRGCHVITASFEQRRSVHERIVPIAVEQISA